MRIFAIFLMCLGASCFLFACDINELIYQGVPYEIVKDIMSGVEDETTLGVQTRVRPMQELAFFGYVIASVTFALGVSILIKSNLFLASQKRLTSSSTLWHTKTEQSSNRWLPRTFNYSQFRNHDAEKYIPGLAKPDSSLVPAHFHITEVGHLSKSFIDCGGKRHTTDSCILRVWIADDTTRRLKAAKLLSWLKKKFHAQET